MCAIFVKVWQNSISASDSSQTENPIKAWAIHTPTLLDNYALLTDLETSLQQRELFVGAIPYSG